MDVLDTNYVVVNDNGIVYIIPEYAINGIEGQLSRGIKKSRALAMNSDFVIEHGKTYKSRFV